jgi:hypothetical protein
LNAGGAGEAANEGAASLSLSEFPPSPVEA